jgi:hypothetical protein
VNNDYSLLLSINDDFASLKHETRETRLVMLQFVEIVLRELALSRRSVVQQFIYDSQSRSSI